MKAMESDPKLAKTGGQSIKGELKEESILGEIYIHMVS